MIDLYTWPTPNGHKVHIMLEEVGLPYTVHPINIGKGEQFDPAFLKISPNNKMPAMVDQQGPDGAAISIFESGAILLYLGRKTGQFLPLEERAYWSTMQWLMFQMGGVGPMLGQNHHFRHYAPEQIDYAINRYTKEAQRLYGVIDKRLSEAAYLAGDQYTVADIATFPWLRGHERQGVNLDDYPHLKRWYQEIDARPAVQRGVQVLADNRTDPKNDEEAKKVLFGDQQYARR
jgi:GST-like protein